MNVLRNIIRTVAVTAAAGFLMAVSCNPITPPDPGPGPVNPQDTTSPLHPQDTTSPVGPVSPAVIIDTTYAVGVSGVEISLTLTSSGDWSAKVQESDAGWCTVSPQSGGKGEVTVTIKVGANDTYDPRSATVELKVGSSTGRIGIAQDCLKGFEINLQDYVMPPLGGSFSIDLQTNMDYSCRIEGGGWVSQKEEGATKGMTPHTHTFEVERNTTGAERACSIVFEGDGFSRSFNVLQHPAYLTLSKKDVSFGKDAASEQIEVSTNVECELVMPREEWLWKEGGLAASEGKETVSLLTFNAVENPFSVGRDAVVIFRNTDYQLCDTLYISQGFESYFSVSEKQFSFGPEGGVSEVRVTTNVDYSCTVPESAGWIREEEDGSVHVFTVDANRTPEERSAGIVFSGGGYSETLVVNQAGACLKADRHEAEFGISGGEVTVKVDHNIPYVVEVPSVGWLSRTGSASDEYTFEVAGNDTSVARECDVVFCSDGFGMSDTLHISQERCVLFEVPQKQYNVGDAGGRVTVRVNSNIEYEHALEDAPEWISEVGPLVFQILPNTSSESREAVLRLTSEAEGISEFVTIIQKQKDVFSLSEYEFELEPEGGDITIEVSSNVEYSYYIEDAPGWISESAQKLTFDVDRNTGTTSRQCSIVFTGGASVQRVTVRQKAPSLSVTPSSVSVFPIEGGEATFTIVSNVPYLVEMPDVQWVDRLREDQKGKLNIRVRPNDGGKRECSIVVSCPDYSLSRTIKISQDQKDMLTVSPSSAAFSPEGGDLVIDVQSNINYTAAPKVSWIAEAASGSTASRRIYKVGKNTSSEIRTGSVAFSGNGLSAATTVTQAAPILDISISEAGVDAAGTSLDVDVEANISYTCSADKNWVTYTNNSGRLKINVAANTTGAARTCVFSVRNTDFSINRTLTISQAQNNVLSVDKASYEFTSDGGTFTPSVTANIEYTVDIPAGWITRDGSKFTVAANEETTSRSATITYSGAGLTACIAVTQAAYIEPDPVPLDGRVTRLQTHTEGNGVNIVIMGDAYTEAQNLDGTYNNMMKKAMEAFFNVEPYTTFRNLFDVYMVNVVSQSDSYDSDVSQRRLATWFGSGTSVGGDDVMCKRYALHAVRPERDDWQTISWDNEHMMDTEVALGNTLVIVMMNREYYAGTCYMGVYWVNDPLLDFTQGNSVAYFSLGSNEGEFEALLHHEAGGHGFGYLADEYCYSGTGTVTQEEIDQYRMWQNDFHAYRNVDFINNPAQVLWAGLLADERYNGEGLGVFEGAGGYYEYGVFKPTELSIMCDNVGCFNAPSREQIYKRLHKLAYGKTWTYDYEEFVAYDAVNLVPATKARRQPRPLPHTGRSVIEVSGRK